VHFATRYLRQKDMGKHMKKKGFSQAIVRFVKRLKWYYRSLSRGPILIQVDLGRKG